MTITYNIEGMTCNGCRSGVEKKLNAIPGIAKATVSLEEKAATIIAEKTITAETIRQFLPEKYTVTAKESAVNVEKITEAIAETSTSDLAKLKPLFLILFYITVGAILMNRANFQIGAFMLDFMGLFYIVFSFFKLLDLKGFPATFQMYDPLAKLFPPYAWIYPFIETALGLCFLLRFQVQGALIATLIILGITTIGVTKTLLSKKQIKCACLGTALNLPMTKATFIENSIMLVMAIWMLLGVK
ncbi:MAG: heavy-metal-associated domain-containing protein [Saprospiraceae bacterium]